MRFTLRSIGCSLFLVVLASLLLTPAGADDAVAPAAPAGTAPTQTGPMAAPTAPEPTLDPSDVLERFDDIPVEDGDLASVPVEEFGTIVVTATGVRRPELIVPRAMNVITQERIRRRGVTSAIDLLDHSVGIWVEKRTSHASDPVIRGLSGSNLLALVDGNTLSTFWGEGGFAGDDMYGKIDPQSLERIEVVRGPASVLYGSNALGGVINFITKESPFDFLDCRGMQWGGRTYAQVNTAPEGWRLRQEVFGATDKLRWFAGVSYMDIGGTRDGSGQWQSPTDAVGWYGDLALNWKINEDVYAKFTVQVADLDPVYRYYRPTQDNENWRLAVAGWLEMPNLSKCVGFADALKLSLYYQDKEDRRNWYDGATGAREKWGVAHWQTIQADLRLQKELCRNELTYGIEFEGTDGESPDDEQFTVTRPDGTVRKDAPDSYWWSLGAYAQDVWKVSPKFSLTGSARVDVFNIKTDVDQNYVPAGGLDPSVDEIDSWKPAFAGGLQGTWHLSPQSNVYGGWTRGFRLFAPRFGVTEHAWGVVVPNELLDPVTADQFEIGFKHRSEHVSFDAIGYYTYFNDFQNVIPGSFQGQDWFDYNGNGMRDAGEDVYVNVGNGYAALYGVELGLDLNLAALNEDLFGEAWTVSAGFVYNYGQDEKNDIPMRHTQPMQGLFAVRWEPCPCPPAPWAELRASFVDRFDRIPPDRLANDVGYLEDPQDPNSGMRRTWGLPGYSVWDLRAGYQLSKNVELTVGLLNIFDKLYRPAHARMDAPGRNFFAAVSITF